MEKIGNAKKTKEEANIQDKEKKNIETKLINNDFFCVTKKCGVENVELMKSENVNVDNKFGGSCNMIGDEKNNVHEKVNNIGNCVNNNLNADEKISEKKSNDLIDSEKEKDRNVEEKKNNSNEEK